MLNLYDLAFAKQQMGYANALAWILFLIIFVLTMLILRSSALWVYNESERK
jgi:multiple sugar transport system permease protein